MAFVEHSDFLLTKNRNVKIWRYMDLSKFLSILDRSSLFFVRVDKLSDFDLFEGYYTKADLSIDQNLLNSLPLELHTNPIFLDNLRKSLKIDKTMILANREYTFVNSWHIQEHESAAMWKLYLQSNEGIAIESSIAKLIDSLTIYDKFDIYIGEIQYIDYLKDRIPTRNLLYPCMHKRKSFEHERELRALIWTPQNGKNGFPFTSDPKNKYHSKNGLHVSIDTNKLIDKIYLSPSAPDWYIELIQSLLNRFSMRKDIIRSDLSSNPLY